MNRALFAVCGLAALCACDDTFFGPKPDTGGTPVDDGWCGVQTIYETSCVSCHGSASPTFGLDLATDPHGSTVDVTGSYGKVLVTPGSKEDSLLWLKMAGQQEDGGVMPTVGVLPQAQVDVVGAWIDAGASDVCDESDADADSDADTDTDSDADADTDTDTDTDVGSWCAVADIITGSGACRDCHDDGADDSYSYIDLMTDPHTALYQAPSQVVPGAVLVVPGYPDASLMYRKISHAQGDEEGQPMPAEGYDKLADADIESVHAWITAGAATEDCN